MAFRSLPLDARDYSFADGLTRIGMPWRRRPPLLALRSWAKTLVLRAFFGVFLTVLGRYKEAESLLAEARDIEPYSAQQNIAEAIAHYQSRRYELSVAEALVHRALAHFLAQDLDGVRSCVADMDSCISKPTPRFD